MLQKSFITLCTGEASIKYISLGYYVICVWLLLLPSTVFDRFLRIKLAFVKPLLAIVSENIFQKLTHNLQATNPKCKV